MKLTERAADRIRSIMAEKGAGTAGLRIGVKKGGCAGMEYTMEWAAEQKPFDEVVEHDGARVLIDPKAVMYLLGTEMDYKTDKLVLAVRVHQPQPDRLVRLRRVRQPGPRGQRQARRRCGAEGRRISPFAVRHTLAVTHGRSCGVAAQGATCAAVIACRRA